MEMMVAHAGEEAVRLESNIEARSAQMECGFWSGVNVLLKGFENITYDDV